MFRATFRTQFHVLLLALVMVGTLASAGVGRFAGGGLATQARDAVASIAEEVAGVEAAEAAGCYSGGRIYASNYGLVCVYWGRTTSYGGGLYYGFLSNVYTGYTNYGWFRYTPLIPGKVFF